MLATTTDRDVECFLQAGASAPTASFRPGELFCYIKYKSRVRSHGKRLAERSGLEDGLYAELGAQSWGGRGHGFGLKYSYIDLALTGAAQLCVVFASSARARAWLAKLALVCDSELERRWLPWAAQSARLTACASSTRSSSSRAERLRVVGEAFEREPCLRMVGSTKRKKCGLCLTRSK